MTVAIMSNKFAPGHFSHMIAYYKLFEEINAKPLLLLDKEYSKFVSEYPEYKSIYMDEYASVKADYILNFSLAIDDIKYINYFRKTNPKVKIYFVYHEPWFGIKKCLNNYFTHKESLIETIKVFGRYFFVKSVLKKVDMVLLPSKKAYDYYQERCMKYNSNCAVFPLILTDEAEKNDINEKKYFSFISTVAPSKNFNMFIKYIKYRSQKDKNMLFQITTRTDISDYIDDELKKLVKEKRLIINHGHSLSNTEINDAYSKSNCTWMLYSRSTQSGVLCKSFMFGTPVIASDIGSFREFVNGENGLLLNNGYSFEDIDTAYEKIKKDLNKYSDNARNTFLKEFYWKNRIDDFNRIFCE